MSFDERIALELDALDQLGTVESPVAERQIITFQKPISNADIVEENNDQQRVFNKTDTLCAENIVDKQESCQVLDCDEVRIMIKVLGPKVLFCFKLLIYLIYLLIIFIK